MTRAEQGGGLDCEFKATLMELDINTATAYESDVVHVISNRI